MDGKDMMENLVHWYARNACKPKVKFPRDLEQFERMAEAAPDLLAACRLALAALDMDSMDMDHTGMDHMDEIKALTSAIAKATGEVKP